MPVNPNKDYWIRRAEATLISGEKSVLEYERELKKAYEAVSAQIEKEIHAFYSKYAKENEISFAEARRRLKPSEKKSFNDQAKIYLNEIAKMGSTPMTKEYMSHLKRLSAKAYMTRLDELNNNIRYNIEKLHASQQRELERTLKEGYEDSYYRTMFNAQKQAKLGISFTTPGKRTVEAAVKEKWLGQNYSDRIWANKDKLIKQLEQILPQEFVRGKGPASVARTLSQKLDVSYNNAKRLARTEMNYISNKATMQAYIDNGIGEYEYVATLDARTSDICRELDGKIFPVKGAMQGVNWPPLHPYCRSTTIPYFEDDDIGKVADDRIARAKDGKGKSIKLGQDVSFFDWVEQYGSPEFKARVKAQRKRFLDMDKSLFDSLVWHETMEKQDLTTMEFWSDYWRDEISPEELNGVRTYTGSGYSEMNKYLRGKISATRFEDEIKHAMAALEKASLPEEVIVRRGTDYNILTELGVEISEANKDKLIGSVVTDKGFMSTSPSPRGGFSGTIEYIIKVPKGSQAMYVDPISVNRGEEELLINRGGGYIIEDIEFTSQGHVRRIYMSLINLQNLFTN